ncbi:hypothetical protein WJX74_000222 [Apatococcus lobatus]|uniref:Uncharacterized protein n=1 Tax=Apatococcus lobatus TaxID=904363 RepID=A0AAW1QHR2_9CHLO
MVELDQLQQDSQSVSEEPGRLTTEAANAFLSKHPLETIYRKLSQPDLSAETVSTLAAALEKLLESTAGGLQSSNQYALAALGSQNAKLRQLGCRQLGFAMQMAQQDGAPERATYIGALAQAIADPSLPVAEEAAAVLVAFAGPCPGKFPAFCVVDKFKALAQSTSASLKPLAGLLEPFTQQLGDASDPLACAAGLQLLADLLEKSRSTPATGRAIGKLAEPAIVQAMHCTDTSIQCQALKVAGTLCMASDTEGAAHSSPRNQPSLASGSSSVLHQFCTIFREDDEEELEDAVIVAALEGIDGACQSSQSAWKLAEFAPELLAAVCCRALAVGGAGMVRITALHALASLLGMSSQDASDTSGPGPTSSPASAPFESSLQSALYDAALEAGAVETPFSILASFMRQPFPELRVAVYRAVSGLALRLWGAAEILRQPILVQNICQPASESARPCCEWRFHCLQVLIKTADAAAEADKMANGGSMQQDVVVTSRSELYRSFRLGMYGTGSNQALGSTSGVPQALAKARWVPNRTLGDALFTRIAARMSTDMYKEVIASCTSQLYNATSTYVKAEVARHVRQRILHSHSKQKVRCSVLGPRSFSATGWAFVKLEGERQTRMTGAKPLLDAAGIQEGDIVQIEIDKDDHLGITYVPDPLVQGPNETGQQQASPDPEQMKNEDPSRDPRQPQKKPQGSFEWAPPKIPWRVPVEILQAPKCSVVQAEPSTIDGPSGEDTAPGQGNAPGQGSEVSNSKEVAVPKQCNADPLFRSPLGIPPGPNNQQEPLTSFVLRVSPSMLDQKIISVRAVYASVIRNFYFSDALPGPHMPKHHKLVCSMDGQQPCSCTLTLHQARAPGRSPTMVLRGPILRQANLVVGDVICFTILKDDKIQLRRATVDELSAQARHSGAKHRKRSRRASNQNFGAQADIDAMSKRGRKAAKNQMLQGLDTLFKALITEKVPPAEASAGEAGTEDEDDPDYAPEDLQLAVPESQHQPAALGSNDPKPRTSSDLGSPGYHRQSRTPESESQMTIHRPFQHPPESCTALHQPKEDGAMRQPASSCFPSGWRPPIHGANAVKKKPQDEDSAEIRHPGPKATTLVSDQGRFAPAHGCQETDEQVALPSSSGSRPSAQAIDQTLHVLAPHLPLQASKDANEGQVQGLVAPVVTRHQEPGAATGQPASRDMHDLAERASQATSALVSENAALKEAYAKLLLKIKTRKVKRA